MTILASLNNAVHRGARSTVASLSPRRSTGTQLWVFGASAGTEFSDNSAVLFKHVNRTRPDVETVWLAANEHVARAAASAGGRSVPLSSVEASVLTRTADAVIFSHGIHDVAGLYRNKNGVVVRLGHGLTAFKQPKGRTPLSVRRMARRVDLAPVASGMEQANKRAWGFSDEKLPITGLPRWDELKTLHDSTPDDARRLVLFAPTWRDWITPTTLPSSRYWAELRSAILTAGLADAAESTGLEPILFAHPKLREPLVDTAARDELDISIVACGEDLPGVLARTALLVTDYSSLAWDAIYLGTPVAFLHSDVEDYLRRRGSHIDLGSRLFGPAVATGHELALLVEDFVNEERRFPAYETDVAAWRTRAFAYQDCSNSERVVARIESAIDSRREAVGA